MLELAIIPARAGSKGLVGKNTLPLGGVALINWTVLAAIHSGLFRRVIVSTDDQTIAQISSDAGAEIPFMRPPELSDDQATSDSVIDHALDTLGVEGRFALLQPTSPFRNAQHLQESFQFWQRSASQMVMSVAPAKPAEWLLTMTPSGELIRLASSDGRAERRQDAQACLLPNGALYMTDTAVFFRGKCLPRDSACGYVMNTIDSIDIDNADDFAMAEGIVQIGKRQPPQ